jgi:hypothetical protein
MTGLGARACKGSIRDCVSAVFLLLTLPAGASAQWYAGEAVGGNHSNTATVYLRTVDTALDFHEVRFFAVPFQPRRYFLLRAGYAGKAHPHRGFEMEWLHFKAIADVTRSYHVTIGPNTPLTEADVQPMSKVIQSYRLDSGINLLSALYVWRQHLSDRVLFVNRVGGGVTFPAPNTIVEGENLNGYEFGGPGAQDSVGLQVRVLPRLAVTFDYKVTYVRPNIHVADGRSWVALTSQHVNIGLLVMLSR